MHWQHQENVRVIFSVFVSGNNISESYIFVTEVFQGLCLWMRIFDICHEAFRSFSQKVGLSYLEVFGCEACVLEGDYHELYLSCTTQFWGKKEKKKCYHIHMYQLKCILVRMVVYIFIYIT